MATPPKAIFLEDVIFALCLKRQLGVQAHVERFQAALGQVQSYGFLQPAYSGRSEDLASQAMNGHLFEIASKWPPPAAI